MKKSLKVLAMSLCIIMLVGLSFALATDAETGAPVQDIPEVQLSDPLKIDTANTYPGMGKSYGKGYIPTVKNGRATIVLPLIGKAKGDVITVTPDIGIDGPFVYANYHFDVKKSNGVFLIKLDLPLKNDRINGTYPVIFNVDYTGEHGDPMNSVFTVYVNITDGKTLDSVESVKAPELFILSYSVTPVRQSTAVPATETPESTETEEVIESTAADTSTDAPASNIDPNMINGGDSFTVTVTLKNIGSATAKNVKLTYMGDEMMEIFAGDGMSTVLVGTIAAGASRTVKFTMEASKTAMAGRHSMMTTLDYSDDMGMPYSAQYTLNVEVFQPVEVQFDKIEFPNEIESGDRITLPIGILNVGRSSIYDVTCKLDVNGLRGASVYIAEITAGMSESAEMNIFAGTLDTESYYGTTSGKLTITYKDAYGEEYVYETNINTEITEPASEADASLDETEPTQPQGNSQWIISVIVGMALIAIAVAVAIVVRFYRLTKIGK